MCNERSLKLFYVFVRESSDLSQGDTFGFAIGNVLDITSKNGQPSVALYSVEFTQMKMAPNFEFAQGNRREYDGDPSLYVKVRLSAIRTALPFRCSNVSYVGGEAKFNRIFANLVMQELVVLTQDLGGSPVGDIRYSLVCNGIRHGGGESSESSSSQKPQKMKRGEDRPENATQTSMLYNKSTL